MGDYLGKISFAVRGPGKETHHSIINGTEEGRSKKQEENHHK